MHASSQNADLSSIVAVRKLSPVILLSGGSSSSYFGNLLFLAGEYKEKYHHCEQCENGVFYIPDMEQIEKGGDTMNTQRFEKRRYIESFRYQKLDKSEEP